MVISRRLDFKRRRDFLSATPSRDLNCRSADEDKVGKKYQIEIVGCCNKQTIWDLLVGTTLTATGDS
jgi:hypothetical protein